MLKCPKCSNRINIEILCSNPPQYECNCSTCDFKLKYYERKNSFNIINQEELDLLKIRTFKYKSLLESEKDLEPNIYTEKDLRSIMIGYYPDSDFLKHYIDLINEISIEEIVIILNSRGDQEVKEENNKNDRAKP